MFTPASALYVDENQRKRLEHLARSGRTPQKIALRARIILAAGKGQPNHAIAQQLGISRPTVLVADKIAGDEEIRAAVAEAVCLPRGAGHSQGCPAAGTT